MSGRDTQALHLERLFDCDVSELWSAWTEAAKFGAWISPFPGLDAEVEELDARPGGDVRFTMVGPDGERYPEEAIFEKVEPEQEIVQFQANDNREDLFGGYPMRMRARFVEEGGKTRLILDHTGYPPSFPMDDAEAGFGSCFDKLAALVEDDERSREQG